ncbi:ribosome rescue GTPase HflX [Cysteiniphilum sp. QT6929]|uniref:ribosome rescue GTPase HflX n=1 Tax=Cysteiniphilum sp. QT6929 TaxID=2975055 RepID=UPI0024B36518|nr:ribosome rescue GTPase HflX [Cysteiniphilum sp. QT6929]WHN66422.1 GTPase HflX [Cysteiniphilum sp. QT6929]
MEIFQEHEVGENCLLIDIDFSSKSELNAELSELNGLVHAANWQIVQTITARRSQPDPKYFCGKGKLEEIKAMIEEHEIDLVVFNHSITPSQERNIEKALNCKVIDRTRLILEIFSQRAQTHEGKLQVELAQLNYAATRLVRGWTHLERQKGGIGVRGGPGETQLELDRRLLRQRIAQIEKRLEKVKKQRGLSRASRQKNDVPTIAFVGYTNAGKSTLFNQLSGASVLAKDQLFATLDPTLRKIDVPKLGEVVLSDTVGFIRNLPHDLVEAFCATLEEAIEADLLVHVIDYADEHHRAYIEQVKLVLQQIEADDKPILNVYNKIDRLDNLAPHIVYHEDRPADVYLSAQTGNGVEYLYEAIARHFNQEWLKGVLTLMPNEGKVRAAFYQLGVVEKEQIMDTGEYQLTIHIAKNDFDAICRNNKLELIAKFSHH